MNPRSKRALVWISTRASFCALLGTLLFKGDACICGSPHRPPPPTPEQPTSAPAASASAPPATP